MATLITLVDGTIPVAADFNTNFTNLNTEVRTVPYGGTGAATLTSNGVLLGQGTSAITATTAGNAYQVLRVPGAGGAPAFGTIDLAQSAAVTGVLAVGNGGTGIAYFTVAGPTVARTYTFPDASATILTTNAAVTVAQGGTGLASGTSGGILGFTAAGTLASSAALTANALLLGGGAGATPSALALGTANYILGMNSGATAHEYKQLVQGSNVTITHAAGSVTIAASGGIGTGDSPTVSGQWTYSYAGPAIMLSQTDGQIFLGTTTDRGWAVPGVQLQTAGSLYSSGSTTVELSNNTYGQAGTHKRLTANPAAFVQLTTTPSFDFYTAATGAQDASVSGTLEASLGTGLQVGSPTGGAKGVGTANFAGDIYKNNSAYNNPKWAFQHFFTGRTDPDGPYAAPPGYQGLRPLEEVEAFVREYHDLPLMRLLPDAGLFRRGDLLMGALEEAYLYLFDLHRRLAGLEAR